MWQDNKTLPVNMMISLAWGKTSLHWMQHIPCQNVTLSQLYHCAVGWFRLTENMVCTVVLVVLTVGTVGTYTGAVVPRRPWPVARRSSLLYRELNRGMLASTDCEVTTDTCKHAHQLQWILTKFVTKCYTRCFAGSILALYNLCFK
jgi:hypothetical protein